MAQPCCLQPKIKSIHRWSRSLTKSDSAALSTSARSAAQSKETRAAGSNGHPTAAQDKRTDGLEIATKEQQASTEDSGTARRSPSASRCCRMKSSALAARTHAVVMRELLLRPHGATAARPRKRADNTVQMMTYRVWKSVNRWRDAQHGQRSCGGPTGPGRKLHVANALSAVLLDAKVVAVDILRAPPHACVQRIAKTTMPVGWRGGRQGR